ncbi:MAG: hypothetical protein IT380_11325 [Myxococcales bacterium]|nr:hypothetical protein [Myxococcales bacterium]
MSELHPLADRYLDALYELPDELRVRRGLEDELAAHMTGGHHACIRGFWRIGKTTLMKGVLQRACERTGGAAFTLDLRDPDRDDGLPQSPEAVLNRVAAKVNDFLGRVGAKELKADPKQPLAVLGELAAPLFVGFDELIALHGLGADKARAVIDALLNAPKNVKVCVVCHRHRDLDALFESDVVARPGVATVMVPPVTDDELVTLVQTPAQSLGVTFSNEALGALAEATGNRPWEVFTLCALAASRLRPDFKGEVAPDAIDALLDLDVLSESEEGRAVVETYLRVLVTAMNAEERTVMEMLSAGKEGEATEDALARLEAAGWVVTSEEGSAVNGDLMEGLARAVAEGVIKVSLQ